MNTSLQSIGIIGNGAFGAFLVTLIERFLPQVQVRVYSRRQTPGVGRFCSFEDTCGADIVLFAVPIHAFEETLRAALPHIPEESIIFDIATVKTHTSNLLRQYAINRRYIATHPMFGPESYAKRNADVTGFRVVVTEHTLPPEVYAAGLDFVRVMGFDVREMSSETHDRHSAETLFLTHVIGQSVVRGGFGRTDIDTVSFGFLMDAVESVRNDEALFKDVFRFNPYARDVLDRLSKGEAETLRTLSNKSL